MGIMKVTKSITAENTFSDAIAPQGGFNFSLSGTWVGKVHLQRSFDGTTWLDIINYTTPTEEIGDEPENGVLYRFGVKTGNYTSGTIVGRISK